jgi:translation elongation factor EF-4
MPEEVEVKSMEAQLLETVHGIRDEGIDLTEQPVVFKWQYEAEKNVHFTLIMEEYEEEITAYDMPTKNDVIH